MSGTIDERIVKMQFNNAQFEKNAKESMRTLDDLKKKLNFDGLRTGLDKLQSAASRFDLSTIAQGVAHMAGKFSAMTVVAVASLTRITQMAVDAGLQIAKSLTVDPVSAGLKEYETTLNSIQTILANTKSKGTTMVEVNQALAELNAYSDKTIYNFAQMARNIGTFTAAGIDLSTATAAIKGIANLAAVSGSNADQAATAMYQLSQALATGTVKLMDWNSVVNAGMGGQVFQDALKETARAHGVAVDQIIAQEGSFRDSLTTGWLTSSILTETLSKFTGDLNAEQLRTMGYTEDQIKGIIELGKTASDAATKVKTMSQLLDTLKEAAGSGWARTWQLIFGDFEEAKSLFTGASDLFGGMLNASAKARNDVLQTWKAYGGRTALIQGVKNAFDALMSVITPIKEAFNEIFPPTTGQQLVKITEAFRDFMKSLKLGGPESDKLKRTFKGFFAVLDIGKQIVSGILGVFGKLFPAAKEGAGGILDFTAGIGDFLVKANEAIKKGEGLKKFFNFLSNILTGVVTAVKEVGKWLGSLFDKMAGVDTDGLSSGFERFTKRLEPLKKVFEFLRDFFGDFPNKIDKVKTALAPVIDKFKDIGTNIQEFFKNADYSNLWDGLSVGLLAGLVIVIKKFLSGGLLKMLLGDSVDGVVNALKGIPQAIRNVFGEMTNTLKAMQTELKSKALMNIAIAIALLAASAIALSFVDSDKLAKALGAMTIMFAELVATLMVFEKMTGVKGLVKLPILIASLILLAVAIDILAVAVSKLGKLDLDDLGKGLLGVAALLLMVGVAAKFISATNPANLIGAAAGMIVVATAVRILASAVAIFAEMSWEEWTRGLLGVGLVLAGLLIFTKLTSASTAGAASAVGLLILAGALLVLAGAVKIFAMFNKDEMTQGIQAVGILLGILAAFTRATGNAANVIATAVGMVILAGALLILSKVITELGALSMEELGTGLVGIGGSLLLIAGAMTLMPKDMLLTAAALAVVGASLLIIADALTSFSDMTWEEIAKGLVTLAGALGIISIALYAMEGTGPGALAILVVAAALAVLAPVLTTLGAMPWEAIATALVTLAALFLVLGVAATLLAEGVPILLLVALSIALIGAGAMAMGAGLLFAALGILAFALAIKTLANIGKEGALTISIVVSAIAALIPFIAAKLAEGIIAFAKVIGESGPTLIAAFTTLLTSFMEAIRTAAPLIVETIMEVINMLLQALADNVPGFVDKGYEILLGILNGINDNIQEVVDAGLDIIGSILDGIAEGLPDLIDSAFNLIITFINSLADAIRENTEAINKAGDNLADAIVDGLIAGLKGSVERVIREAKKVAQAAIDAAKKVLGIHSPSRAFMEIGKYSTEGFAQGIEKNAHMAEDSATNVGESALTALKKSISNIGAAVASEMDVAPTIRPVLDLSEVRKDANKIKGMFHSPNLALNSTYTNAATASSGYQAVVDQRGEVADTTSAVQGDNITFVQNNNSPKALSAAEIYRQTKNQLSVAKGDLVGNA